ncbi:MAG: hypothetical protein RRB13_00860 [bacterium]|nr:hypothetical protein [bacterium]
MAEEEKKDSQNHAAEGNTQGKAPGNQIDPALLERIKEALPLPIPDEDNSWDLPKLAKGKEKGALFGLLKKKELPFETLAELRKSAVMSPGNTLLEVQRLRKKFPSDATLMMLSATCTNGMMTNSSSKKGVLEGLKGATREAGGALLADGLSLFNCDNFLAIYYNYLNRLKREQAAVIKQIINEPRLNSEKLNIGKSLSACDYLSGDKTKNQAIMGHLKKKIKSSKFTTPWSFNDIRGALKAIEANNLKEEFGIGTAQELVSFTYAVMVAFARIPMLWPVVETVLEMFPENNMPLFLRKRSVIGVRRINHVKIAQARQDRTAMAKSASALFKESLAVLGKIEGQPVRQPYESEPYFNLALAAQIAMGTLHPEEQLNLLRTSLKYMENLIKLDMSKNHRYTETAKQYTHMLSEMINSFGGDGSGDGQAAS